MSDDASKGLEKVEGSFQSNLTEGPREAGTGLERAPNRTRWEDAVRRRARTRPV